MVSPVPEDFHTITPQLVVSGVAERGRLVRPGRSARTNCCATPRPTASPSCTRELLLGDSRFFVVDEFPGAHAVAHARWAARR